MEVEFLARKSTARLAPTGTSSLCSGFPLTKIHPGWPRTLRMAIIFHSFQFQVWAMKQRRKHTYYLYITSTCEEKPLVLRCDLDLPVSGRLHGKVPASWSMTANGPSVFSRIEEIYSLWTWLTQWKAIYLCKLDHSIWSRLWGWIHIRQARAAFLVSIRAPHSEFQSKTVKKNRPNLFVWTLNASSLLIGLMKGEVC